ncbi:MAG: 2-phospho-L-lactate guanylyltransferase [Hyphomicrobiales bacterium]
MSGNDVEGRAARPGTSWAIVPVKMLAEAKSRLDSALSPAMRRLLVLTMLEDVLDILHGASGVDRILVVTADRHVGDLACRKGATILREERSCGLNAAISLGARHALRHGAVRALFVPADVPLATTAEIDRILAPPGPEDSFRPVIVPASDLDGTNALLLAPPDALDPDFGVGSFARHCRQAVARGLEPRVLRLAGLGTDIDEPKDLARLAERSGGSPRYAFLRKVSRTQESMTDQKMGVSEP